MRLIASLLRMHPKGAPGVGCAFTRSGYASLRRRHTRGVMLVTEEKTYKRIPG